MRLLKLTLMSLTLLVAGFALIAIATNPSMAQTKGEICDNGVDDDGDKAVDCDDKDCALDAACTKNDGGCSPGYYKNHTEDWIGICCTDASDPTCGELFEALTCRGSDRSCGRSAAAEFLDMCTGCTE